MRPPPRRVVPLFLAFVASACNDASQPTTINVALGTPRPLIYVADDPGVPKHGGNGSGSDGIVHVFDATTFEHVGEFEVGEGIGEAQATRDGRYVWFVANTEGAVQILDTTTWDLNEVDVGVRPSHSFLSPDGASIWLGNDGSADVSVIDPTTSSEVARFITGTGHHKMAFATDAGGALVRAYMSNLVDGTITPVTPAHAVTTNVPGVGRQPHGMDYAETTKRVYNCSGDDAHDVEVIATTDEPGGNGDETNTIVARVPLPSRCSFLRVSPDGAYADVTIPGANLFGRIRLADHVLTTVSTGAAPDVFAHVGNRAYVGNALESTVTVVDFANANTTSTITVGASVTATAKTGERYLRAFEGRIYVVNGFDGTVSVIDDATTTVVATLADMHAPTGVAVAGPNGGSSYPR